MPGQPFIQFGSGLLFCKPNAGNLAVNPTPVKPYTIQDIKFGQKGKLELLRGQNQYPDDTATGDKDGTFEFSMGRKDYFLLNQLFNADTVAVGGVSVAPNEFHAIAATLTIVPPSTGVFSEDLGVSLQVNGKQFQKVATAPTAGQYSVVEATGIYTFNAADVSAAAAVLISYSYTLAALGTTYQVNNQVQGYGPAFEAFIVDTYQPVVVTGLPVYSIVRLAAAKISDVEFDNKRSGYSMVSLKGSYFVGPNNRVIDFFSNV